MVSFLPYGARVRAWIRVPGLRFALLWAIFDASLRDEARPSTRMDCKKRPVRQQEAVVQLPGTWGAWHIAFETPVLCWA